MSTYGSHPMLFPAFRDVMVFSKLSLLTHLLTQPVRDEIREVRDDANVEGYTEPSGVDTEIHQAFPTEIFCSPSGNNHPAAASTYKTLSAAEQHPHNQPERDTKIPT